MTTFPVQAEITECASRFREVTAEPVDGAYLLRLAAKTKEALDQGYGPGNRYAAELVHIVETHVHSPKADVPPSVAGSILQLLVRVARASGFSLRNPPAGRMQYHARSLVPSSL